MSPTFLKSLLTVSASFCMVSVGVLVLTVSANVRYVSDKAAIRLDLILKPLQAVVDNSAKLADESRALVKTVKDGYDDTYYDQKAIVESTAALVRQAHETLRVTTEEIKSVSGDARGLIRTASAEMEVTSKEVRETLPALQEVLARISALTSTLDRELTEASPRAIKTIDTLTRSLEDLDKLIADPSNPKLLASVAATADNLDQSTKSVDMALRPLREKAGKLKTILKYALGAVKVTFPIF